MITLSPLDVYCHFAINLFYEKINDDDDDDDDDDDNDYFYTDPIIAALVPKVVAMATSLCPLYAV